MTQTDSTPADHGEEAAQTPAARAPALSSAETPYAAEPDPGSCTVLVVDDTPLNLQVMAALLSKEGYEVLVADSGEMALATLAEVQPDLILLDIMMPRMSGYELLEHLQTRPELAPIPVIFITALSRTEDVVKGLNAGAVDYITKPINRAEVVARVRTHLRLYNALREIERLRQLALDANPLTGLPGNNSIRRALARALAEGGDAAVVYADLDGFKAFNDAYGFSRGDEMLVTVADILREAIQPSQPGRFLGHVGGDDFVFLAPAAAVDSIAETIAARMEAAIPELYDEADRQAGGVESEDRQGHLRHFPFATLSMAGVRLADRDFQHPLEISSVCASVKKKAKERAGNVLVMDRRRGEVG